MNFKVYKWCAVPQCINTSLKTPNKLFDWWGQCHKCVWNQNVWLKNFSQLDRKKRTSGIVQRPYMIKKQRIKAIEECEKQLLESSTVPERLDVTEASGSSGK